MFSDFPVTEEASRAADCAAGQQEGKAPVTLLGPGTGMKIKHLKAPVLCGVRRDRAQAEIVFKPKVKSLTKPLAGKSHRRAKACGVWRAVPLPQP